MSSTWFQAFSRIQETVQLAEDQRLSLTASTAVGYLTQEAVILADGLPFDTFDASAYDAALNNTRSFAASFLNSFGGELAPCFVELAKVISPGGVGVPQTQPDQILPLVYRYMAIPQQATAFANPATDGGIGCSQTGPLINSRNITRGTPTYGSSNVGTGLLKRLNVDAYGFSLEGGYAQTLNATCTADAQSGTITGQEQFSVLGQPFRDPLTWFGSGYGSGITLAGSNGLVGVTADTTQSLIQNSSFSQFTGTNASSSFALTGWTQTVGSAASLSVDTTNYYRAAAIEGTTPGSLSVTATSAISQTLAANAGALAITAYLNQLAVNFSIGGGTGSVTVQIGSKSWTVNSGVAGWNLLLPTLNKNLWFQNFNQAALAVTITVTVTGGTSIKVDDLNWAPMQSVDGALYWLIGSATAFLVNDTIVVVDSEPSPPSKIQNWLRLMYPGYYLASAVLPTAPVTAATVVLSGTAGAVTAGAHIFYTTFVNATAESGLGPASSIVVADGTHKIDLSAIPTGPGGTLARGIYSTRAGGTTASSTPYLVGYVAGNVTTTLAANVADAALLKQPPSTGDPVN